MISRWYSYELIIRVHEHSYRIWLTDFFSWRREQAHLKCLYKRIMDGDTWIKLKKTGSWVNKHTKCHCFSNNRNFMRQNIAYFRWDSNPRSPSSIPCVFTTKPRESDTLACCRILALGKNEYTIVITYKAFCGMWLLIPAKNSTLV